MLKRINVNKIIAFIGYAFINVSLVLIITSYINYKENKIKINNFVKSYNTYDSINNIISPCTEYLGILEIPKLNLKRGFYDVDNKKNNVNENVTILKNSTLPDVNNNILVLAAHSGNGIKSYFNKIDELDIDDIIYIYYKNIKYTYNVSTINVIDKNGLLNINYINKSQLILTTCDKNDKTKQLVIKAFLINSNPY